MRYTLKFWRDDMGSFTQCGITDKNDALWHVNNARDHDNLPRLRSLDDGDWKLIPEYKN